MSNVSLDSCGSCTFSSFVVKHHWREKRIFPRPFPLREKRKILVTLCWEWSTDSRRRHQWQHWTKDANSTFCERRWGYYFYLQIWRMFMFGSITVERCSLLSTCIQKPLSELLTGTLMEHDIYVVLKDTFLKIWYQFYKYLVRVPFNSRVHGHYHQKSKTPPWPSCPIAVSLPWRIDDALLGRSAAALSLVSKMLET
jgi:hypothetical protein